MAEVCNQCSKKPPGKPGDISFLYRNHKVTVFKNGKICAECLKKNWIKNLENCGKGLILSLYGRLKINWKFFVEAESQNRSDRLADILLSFGILSPDPKGNWKILSDALIELNPKFTTHYLYFTRREDAMDYVRAKHSNTLYGWRLEYTKKTIIKEKVSGILNCRKKRRENGQ